ncbi:DUF1015 domain-containing protein [bacterium]|nr:DUF1015 domain-containing protein [bacterium]
MAEVRAFQAWRYDLSKVGKLDDVIAPPYDVIDAKLSDHLHAKSPHNVIRLILDPILPTDDDNNNRYTRSAKTLAEWKKSTVVTQEEKPSFYIYYQTFDWEGKRFTRRGFMGRVRLEKFGQGKIYPHEQTMSGPKADRLKLFHATGMNLSQIFGLFPDDSMAVAARLDQAIHEKAPSLEATDHLGVEHQIWIVDDPAVTGELSELLADKPIFIADGHHRYETSIKHMEEREAAGKVQGPDAPERFTLMMLVAMSDPGLQVMPTHRLVKGIGKMTADQLAEKLSPYFDTRVVGQGISFGEVTWSQMVASGKQEVLGFATVADGRWTIATLRDSAAMKDIVPDRSDVYRSLGVSILHRLALEKCLGLMPPDCTYVHLVQEVLDSVANKTCDLACLVQPATVEHIRQLSGTFETMPAKSTYFYPKLASGILFNPIQGS